MADYWKSQPRKFCQYCKCWIADNKPSIEFHERGKNHKENVTAKIEEIKKKSMAKAKQEKKMSKEFAAMEEAALKAYEQDLKRLSGQSGESVSASPAPAKPAKAQSKPKRRHVKAELKESRNDQAPVSHVWLEGSTDDGQIYYYNTITGESQWEKPEVFQGESSSVTGQTQGSSGGVWMEAVSPDGYTYYYNAETGESSWKQPDNLEQQNRSPQEETQEETAPPRPEALSGSEDSSDPPQETTKEEPAKSKQTKVAKISFRKQKEEQSQTSDDGDGEQKSGDGEGKEEEEEKETDRCASETFPAIKDDVIPAKKPRQMNPYGAWEQIQTKDDPYVNVDLQLPHTETASDAAPSASDLPPEPKARFKERTITSLGDDECDAGTTFKKRKTENGKSRSIRQRAQDE